MYLSGPFKFLPSSIIDDMGSRGNILMRSLGYVLSMIRSDQTMKEDKTLTSLWGAGELFFFFLPRKNLIRKGVHTEPRRCPPAPRPLIKQWMWVRDVPHGMFFPGCSRFGLETIGHLRSFQPPSGIVRCVVLRAPRPPNSQLFLKKKV